MDDQSESSARLLYNGIYGFHGYDAATGYTEEVFRVELLYYDIKCGVDDVFLTVECDQVVVLVFSEYVGDT